MLDIRQLSATYGQHRALENVSLRVDTGEIVVILGANGAGKSTLLRAIGGICEGRVSGHIDVETRPILGSSADRIVEAGVALVPEGRGIFGDLSVRENLILGAYASRAREDESANLERVFDLFPKLAERQGQIARTMSGGEQQMVAIGRAMMSNPQILMLDEPSLGLSPLLCKELFQSLTQVRRAGIGILLVEQNAKQSLAIADRGYLLENGQIVHADSADNLARDPAVQKAYLGAGGSASTTSAPKETHTTGDSAPKHISETPFVQDRPTMHQTADQLLGQSVDAMVTKAAKQSASKSANLEAGPRPDDHDARLQAILKDIELSASAARRRRHKPETKMQSDTAPIVSSSPRKPAVVEVYRAPRVEVYRRRKNSTEFDRD